MRFVLLAFAFLLSAPAAAAEEDAVRAVLEAQVEAWNRGDIEGFMEGYWKSDRVRFASGGSVTTGWQETLESYRERYGTREKMGTLSLRGLDIRVLSESHAYAFGKWRLKRKEASLSGVFTLVFEKIGGAWRIVHDHSSEAPLPASVVGD